MAALETWAASVDEVCVAVVGAGFGGLINCVFRAFRRAGVAIDRVQLLAVEKNPVAVDHLRRACESEAEWKRAVTVVLGDMRNVSSVELLPWHARVHLMVSELLGSFGDNELSPECLYPAEVLLAAGAVCIPQEYTSFAAPIHASLLRNVLKPPPRMAEKQLQWLQSWWVVRSSTRRDCPAAVAHGRPKRANRRVPARLRLGAGETDANDPAFAVESVQCCPAQPVFRFSHPSNASCPASGQRQVSIAFPECPFGLACDGFIGFFTARLFGHIELSTCPGVSTPELAEWLPAFIPTLKQFTLPASLTMRRVASEHNVWYEWDVLASSSSTPMVHNTDGKCCAMALLAPSEEATK